MLITRTVKIMPKGTGYKYYASLGYKWKPGDYIEIKIEHLAKNSDKKVEVMCEGGCRKIFFTRYNVYVHSIKNNILHDYCCSKCNMQFRNNKENNPMNNPETAKKAIKNQKKTLIKQYNVEHLNYIPGMQEKIRKAKENSGFITPLEYKKPWELYKLNCKKITNRLKKELFLQWNVYDYYDEEYIKNNFKFNCFDNKYPTIDHKISIIYGFKKGISPEKICKLENLCVTKREHNNYKNYKNEIEYKNIILLKSYNKK